MMNLVQERSIATTTISINFAPVLLTRHLHSITFCSSAYLEAQGRSASISVLNNGILLILWKTDNKACDVRTITCRYLKHFYTKYESELHLLQGLKRFTEIFPDFPQKKA
jgi:hypothetical protein